MNSDTRSGPLESNSDEHTRSTDSGASSRPPLGSIAIGRYLALSTLGAGAMGLVLAAYDPKLDRKVALKLLKSRHADPHAARLRLQREAQALAKLNHPNVVAVYDVGIHEDQVFVAMEFVRGQTLAQWTDIDEAPRPWPEVLAVFMAAARGLAAAHEVGLVHRDFKPDNVMLGDDGRVRVMDFGLARVDLDPREDHADAASAELAGMRAPIGRLTQTGKALGTPAYMPFEQFDGRDVDARSDQFSFCVALYEALYDERPHTGSTTSELLRALDKGSVRPAPQSSSVPKWLREVVVRGLAKDPEQRWPSMQALLDALANDPALRRAQRLRWAGAVGLLSTTLAAATWAFVADTPEPCAIDESVLAGSWDDERRAAVRRAFADTELGYAETSAELVVSALDRWGSAWVDARRSACVDTRISGVQSEQLLDLRTACLDRRRRELDAIVDVLTRADTKVVARVGTVIAQLPGLGVCSDPESLSQPFPMPDEPARARAIEHTRATIAQLRARWMVGGGADARVQVDALREVVAGLDYLPLTLELRTFAGTLVLERSEFDVAVDELMDVAREAHANGLDDHAAEALTTLTLGTAATWSQPEREAWLLADAEATLRRLARPNDPRAVSLLETRARLACQAGDHEQALADFEAALARAEALELSFDTSAVTLEIAGELSDLARFDAAGVQFERAMQLARHSYGDGSPAVAVVHYDTGLFEHEQGAFESAREHLERARELFAAAYGRDALDVAQANFALAALLTTTGDFAAARAPIDEALASFQRSPGPDHELTGRAFVADGALRYFDGDFAGAVVSFERALDILGAVLGESHEDIAVIRSNIGESLLALGDSEGALAAFERALLTFERMPTHPAGASPLKGRALVHLASARYELAIADLERAEALLAETGYLPLEQAEVRFALAMALDGAAREPERAAELARAARDAFEEFGVDDRKQAVDDWLSSNPDHATKARP